MIFNVMIVDGIIHCQSELPNNVAPIKHPGVCLFFLKNMFSYVLCVNVHYTIKILTADDRNFLFCKYFPLCNACPNTSSVMRKCYYYY